MNQKELYALGIDIGSTTVKIAILDENNEVVFSDYERHFANIQETLSDLLGRAVHKLGPVHASPVITGSGGLTLAKHLGVPFVQEVIAVSTALQDYAPQTDVAIELGGEDAKIIYFEGGNVEQRMNGVCAGGTGSFIDQMASLLQTDASGLNEYAKNYKALYTIAAHTIADKTFFFITGITINTIPFIFGLFLNLTFDDGIVSTTTMQITNEVKKRNS